MQSAQGSETYRLIPIVTWVAGFPEDAPLARGGAGKPGAVSSRAQFASFNFLYRLICTAPSRVGPDECWLSADPSAAALAPLQQGCL
jgi:hypothetical protein